MDATYGPPKSFLVRADDARQCPGGHRTDGARVSRQAALGPQLLVRHLEISSPRASL